MSFLLRRPFIFIVIGVITIVAVFAYTGVLTPKPAGLTISASLQSPSIKIGQNTTLTIVIENKASQPQTFELRIVYSANLTFYDKNTGIFLLITDKNPKNNSITYPTKGTLSTQGSTTIPILVKGLTPLGSSETQPIFVEVYSVDGYKTLADKKSVLLEVKLS